MSQWTHKPSKVSALVCLKLKERDKEVIGTEFDYMLIRVSHYALPRNTGKQLAKNLNEYDKVYRLLLLGHRYYLDYGTKNYKRDLLSTDFGTKYPVFCNKDFIEGDGNKIARVIYIFEDDRWMIFHKGEYYVISSVLLDDLKKLEELVGYATPMGEYENSLSPNQQMIVKKLLKKQKINLEEML